MSLKFIGKSVILERRHDKYKLPRRVKAHFFESPNGNIVLRAFNDEFHCLSKTASVVMNREKFEQLPKEPEAKADKILRIMGWG
ncbi:MAG: hypothetical protein KAI17_09435 [Thiotrichaceae bacterium]|nr:hypothetical protein [Thiotrichaceae bacterium]